MHKKVPIQKGKLDMANPLTHKMQTYDEKMAERKREVNLTHEHQKLDLHVPKVK